MLRRQLQASRRSGQSRSLLEIGNPLLYAAQYGLLLWLRADMGIQYGNTLRASGTSPPAVTITGTPTALIGLHVEIDSVAGGTGLGQATFKWSIDNGATYVATGVATAASVVLGSTGITAAFAAGPYNVDNKYDVTVAQWNDQSGNGNHAAQATAANQPKINVPTSGTPQVLFNGVSETLAFGTSLSTAHNSTFACCNKIGAPGSDANLFSTREHAFMLRTGSFDRFAVYANAYVDSGIAITATPAVLHAVERAFNDIDIGVNGVVSKKPTASGIPREEARTLDRTRAAASTRRRRSGSCSFSDRPCPRPLRRR
jgi:hypothetical protein